MTGPRSGPLSLQISEDMRRWTRPTFAPVLPRFIWFATMRRQVGLDGRDILLITLLVAGLVVAAVLEKGRWLAVVGTVATVVGVAVAIGQVRLARDQIARAVTVGEATQRAVVVTREKLARSLFTDTIRQLVQADKDLFNAIHDQKSAADVGECLTSWRDAAYDAVALMEGVEGLPRGLRDALVETAKAAAEARETLGQTPDLRTSGTAQIRSEISAACGLLSRAKMKLMLDVRTDNLDG